MSRRTARDKLDPWKLFSHQQEASALTFHLIWFITEMLMLLWSHAENWAICFWNIVTYSSQHTHSSPSVNNKFHHCQPTRAHKIWRRSRRRSRLYFFLQGWNECFNTLLVFLLAAHFPMQLAKGTQANANNLWPLVVQRNLHWVWWINATANSSIFSGWKWSLNS